MGNNKNTYTGALIILTALFFMWGFITVLVDALIPRLRDVFELTYFQAGLVQFAFFTAYALVSIPAGYLIAKVGYKKGVVIGLLTMGVACFLFFPASSVRVFGLFLLSLFILAAGITILQVAANPYVASLGPEDTASSRLNLSQAFNSLGTTIAPLVGAAFILDQTVLTTAEINVLSEADRLSYYASEASAVQGPFIVLAVILVIMAIFFAIIKLPNVLESDEQKTGSYRSALKNKHLVLGAVGIFVYVGAEVTIGSYLVNYFLSIDMPEMVLQSTFMVWIGNILSGGDITNLNPARIAGTFVFFYWGGAMVGRFIGSYLLSIFDPGKMLGVYALINVVLLFFAIITSGLPSVWVILIIGLFNSIMFPTIFTLAIKGLGNNTAQGSGILCTAIVGGAFIPPFYGFMADYIGLQLAFIIPVACYLYISFYGYYGHKIESPSTAVA